MQEERRGTSEENFQKFSKFSEGFFHFKLGSFVQTQQQMMNLLSCVCQKEEVCRILFLKNGVSFQCTLLLLFLPPLASSCHGVHLGHRPQQLFRLTLPLPSYVFHVFFDVIIALIVHNVIQHHHYYFIQSTTFSCFISYLIRIISYLLVFKT